MHSKKQGNIVIRYIVLVNQDLKDIDHRKKSKDDLVIKELTQISPEATLDDLFTQFQKTQNISLHSKLRAWQNQNDMTIDKLYKDIVEKCRPLHYEYRIPGIGKLMENEQAKVQQMQLKEGDYFIVQCVDKNGQWFLRSPNQKKCQGCYKMRKLPYQCGCKKVAYCTKSCLQGDKRYHLRLCTYAEEEELNKKIQMVMTKESAKGLVGLSNLGNTCFMNSCLQCLSHTMPITQYFLQSCYEGQINKQNPLGTKGKLAKAYAKFIKHMWCQSDNTFSPYSLKSAVGSINHMFSGYAQHDSQQFFSFIADGIHEDLNRIKKKPYIQTVQSKGREDRIVAKESWLAYTQRNQSIIVDNLTGQYKSKVVCPDCKKESITFDPFTTVTLPIPEETAPGILKYYVLFAHNEEPTKKMSFQYKKADPKNWTQKAAGLLNRSRQQFKFYALTMYEDIYSFDDTSKSEIMSKIEVQNKSVFLIELSKEELNIQNKVQFVTKFTKKTYYGDDFDALWFKRPFFFQKTNLKGVDIYKRILKYLYSDTYDNSKKRSRLTSGKSYEDYMHLMMKERPFKLILKSKKTIQAHYHRRQLKFGQEVELIDDTNVEQILAQTPMNDIEIQARFNKDGYKEYSFERLKKYDDCTEKYSYKESSQKVTVQLDKCFQVLEKPQELEKGNQWFCPYCKDHKLATKELTIYKAPDILILHLKRFKSKGIIRKQKNQANIQFPQNLDLGKYVIDPTPMSTYIEESKKEGVYIQPTYTERVQVETPPKYDLYAISNHYGGLGGGHYTAYCKNDGRWYQFNDSSVHSVSEESLRGSGAYMLFYKRRYDH